jgi:hypothetical protein
MIRASAIVLTFFLLVACSADTSAYDLDEWLPLLALQGPVRFERTAQAVDDGSCMDAQGGVKVIGNVDAATFDEVIGIVRARNVRDAILLVRAKGRYAEVWTGGGCDSLAGGNGEMHHLRRDNGSWVLKESTHWVQ